MVSDDDEPFERDEDGKPIWPGDHADVATKHAHNVALEEWKSKQGDGDEDPEDPPDDPGVAKVED